MKLLVFSWLYEITLKDVIFFLNKMSIEFDICQFDLSGFDKSNCPELYYYVKKSINQSSYDALLSINYFPDIAKACNNNDLLYISWTYDCPLDITDVQNTIALPTNRAFFFDRSQYEEYKNPSNTVFHFPLAVNAISRKNLQYNPSYSSDISFVGKVYQSTFPFISQYLDDYYIGYLKALIEYQKNIYGSFIIKEILDDEFIKELNTNLKKNNSPYTQENEFVSLIQIAVSLAAEATFENRLLYLGLLAKRHNLKWYTTANSSVIPNVIQCPPVDYQNEMPFVFKSSKINLHIGLHAIPSGISLRQLDIMSCGGFLLSSFQPELFEHFVPGEDFDYFSSAEEAIEKCDYYLSHNEIREKIAISGMNKTNTAFNYEKRLQELFNLAFQ